MVPASGSPHEQSADDDRDRDAEEFERLAESRGLLGALGEASHGEVSRIHYCARIFRLIQSRWHGYHHSRAL